MEGLARRQSEFAGRKLYLTMKPVGVCARRLLDVPRGVLFALGPVEHGVYARRLSDVEARRP
eukprot:8125531-Heterocapsa_arctica.AAC.1